VTRWNPNACRESTCVPLNAQLNNSGNGNQCNSLVAVSNIRTSDRKL
jgi:hypothetical protein